MVDGNLWKRLNSDILDQYSNKPIFIVGAPRSGTTVMRYIIDSHPNIFCPHIETFYFDVIKPFLKASHIWDSQYEKTQFSRDDYNTWIRDSFLQLIANFGSNTSKKRFAEKTPSHTQTMDIIKEVFPDAQFIHMIRNGYEVCSSLGRMSWGPKQVEKQAALWKERVLTAREFGKKLSSDDYLEVKLEDLKSDFTATIKNVCNFLGEKFDDQMEQYHLPENNSWGVSLSKFSQEINKHSFDKKDVHIVNDIASDLLAELKYTIN